MTLGLRSRIVLLALVGTIGIADALPSFTLHYRDYTGNLAATNRSWFYKNTNGTPKPEGEGVYPPVEWNYLPDEDFPVVQVKNGAFNLALTFANYSFGDLNGTFSVTGVRLRIPTPSGGETYFPLTFGVANSSLVIESMSEGTANITIMGLPPYVTMGYLEVDAEVSSGPFLIWGVGSYMTFEKIYVIHNTLASVIDQPWTDLLEYACKWADGQSTESGISTGITRGFYFSGSWTYDGGVCRYWRYDTSILYAGIPNGSSSQNRYRLKALLDDGGGALNCADVSGFLYLNLLCLGVPASCPTLLATGSTGGFLTNALCFAPKNPTFDMNYIEVGFSYHQITSSSNLVYDGAAAQKYDPQGYEYRLAPANWQLNPYWQTVIGGDTFGLVWGLPGPPAQHTYVPLTPYTQTVYAFIRE